MEQLIVQQSVEMSAKMKHVHHASVETTHFPDVLPVTHTT